MSAPAYIHPIIEAFAQGQNAALERARLAQQGTQFTEAQKQQKELEEERLAQEKELRQAAQDLARKQFEHQVSQDQFTRLMQSIGVAQGIQSAGGQLPTAPGSTVTPPLSIPPNPITGSGFNAPATGEVSLPGMPDIRMPAGMFATPQQRMNMIRQQAEAEAGGKAAGAAPFEQSLEAQKAKFAQDLQTARDAAELARTNVLVNSENGRAQLQRDTQMKIAGMQNSTEMFRTQAEYGIDPTSATAIGTGIFTGRQKVGTTDLTNPIVRRIVAAGEAQGFKLPGDAGDELKTLNTVAPILDRFQAFANKLPTGKTTALLQRSGIYKELPTDLNNEYAKIYSDLQNVGKALEGFSGGRILSKQFESESGGIPTVGITRQQAIDRVNNLRQRVEERKNAILNQFGPAQKDLLKNEYLTNQQPTATGVTHIFDKNTGQIVPVTPQK